MGRVTPFVIFSPAKAGSHRIDNHPVNPANPCSFPRLCRLVMVMPVYLCTGA